MLNNLNDNVSARLKKLIRIFEFEQYGNELTRQQLCDLLDIKSGVIDNMIRENRIVAIDRNKFRLHERIFEQITLPFPNGHIRRDKQLLVPHGVPVDAALQTLARKELVALAKEQNLLIETLQFHPDNTYTMTFHPARFNRSNNKILFDIAEEYSIGKLLSTAAISEGQGHWELST